MRALTRMAVSLACLGTFAVTGHADPAATAAELEAAARRAALERILAVRGSDREFQKAIGQAREAGVAPQAILEARFLYQVDKGDDAALVRMLPEFIQQQPSFKIDDSAIFGVTDDWLAVIEYLKSLAALEAGDRAAFKQHITEAFWLSPRQAAAFAPHIERIRTADAMRDVRLDFSRVVETVLDGEEMPLSHILGDNKALLLHFWSPWTRECEAFMPEFASIASRLSKHGIAIASLLPGDVDELIDDAREIIRTRRLQAAGAWIVDPAGGVLARRLRVRNLPTMVLVAPGGEVLFNGDPADKAMWSALSEIDERIKRPSPLPDGEP